MRRSHRDETHKVPAEMARQVPRLARGGPTRGLVAMAAVAVIGACCGLPGGETAAAAASSTSVSARNTGAVQASKPRCTLNVIDKVFAEPAALLDRQTASWVLIQNANWTAWVPNGAWVLDAGPQGADIHSPDDLSDASMAAYNAVPGNTYTFASLSDEILSAVSNVHVICRTPVARNTSAEVQATELTGVYNREAVHVVIILTVYFTSGNGEIRDVYTPKSQWTTGNETALMLVLRRAIEVPQSLTP